MIKLLGFARTRVRDIYVSVTHNLLNEGTEPSETFDENAEEEEEEDDEDKYLILTENGFAVEGILGEGAFSSVVKAFSEKHDRYVAIKIITRRKVPLLFQQKFLPRELKLVKSLRHDNIIKFLSVTETTKSIYVVMNMAPNGSLLDVIHANKYIDEKRACRWFHHLLEGIAYCHSKGVTHRDLKCENLLLDDINVLKVTDFSFAREGLPSYIIKDEENVDRGRIFSSSFCGSYAYACPEILMKKPYEPHISDTWSMGIILYSMLYGRLPFNDKNFDALLQQAMRPVRFHAKPFISFNARNLILKILSPLKIRIYIPKIKRDDWYILNFDSKNEENYQTPEALRQPVDAEEQSFEGVKGKNVKPLYGKGKQHKK